MSFSPTASHCFHLSAWAYGQRLDKVLVHYFPQYSRNKINQWIESGQIHLNGHQILKSGYLIKPSDEELACFSKPEIQTVNWGPEEGEIAVIFEDDSFLIVNKPVNLVVHPSEGTPEGSLVNFLHHAYPALNQLPRCGLIHRLDKGTSGLLIVAKTQANYDILSESLKNRDIQREYRALVWGTPNAFGLIDKPIGRHPIFRKKMAILSVTGKPAQTQFYKVAQFDKLAYIRVQLKTGRTHQIRVHLSDLCYPLLGDKLYGGPTRYKTLQGEEILWEFPALHAQKLSFIHPLLGTPQVFQAPLPDKFIQTLQKCGYSSESLNPVQ